MEQELEGLIDDYLDGRMDGPERQRFERRMETDPEIRLGLLAKDHGQRLIEAASAMGAEAINPRVDMVTARLCATAHSRGLKVYTWTCDDPREMRRLIEDGVDGIMTNYPDRLHAVLTD